ncbi:MAG TPA: hypothetical protein DIV41_02930 [Ruminococcaceae bacterium]|nr:hypothetical protein [Oscillospiraceae bacterium]
MNKKNRSVILSDSLNTFGTNLINTIIQVLSTLIILRRIRPEVSGLIALVQLWGGGLCTILGLSVTAAIIYFVSKYKIQNVKPSIKKLTLCISFIIVLIGACVVFLLRNSSFFKETAPVYLVFIVVYGLCSFILSVCTSVLRGENKFRSYNIINLTQQILVTLLAIGIAMIYTSALLWVLGIIAINVMMIIISLYFINRGAAQKAASSLTDKHYATAGNMIKYSLKSHVSNVLTYVNSNFGGYVVQGAYNIGDYGVFSKALTIIQKVWILPDAVSQVIMSRIAEMDKRENKLRITLISSKIVSYITTIAAFALLLIAYAFVPTVFPMYKGLLEPLKFLIIGCIFISYSKILGNSIAAFGKPELNIIPTLLGVVVNIIASLLLVPVMGINGVALATSLSLTVQSFSNIIIFCRFTHIHAKRLFLLDDSEKKTLKNFLVSFIH